MIVRELYKPIPVGVNATVKLNPDQGGLGNFYAVTAGTITIVNNAGTTVLTAFPVSAGQVVLLQLGMESGSSGTFTTAGGASGTLTV